MAYSSWSVVFGEQPSAAKWNILGANDAFFDSLVGSGTAYSSWAPSWTNVTIGNATVTGKYIQLGKTVFYDLYVVIGSTTSITGPITYSLPVTSASNYTANKSAVGTGLVSNSGTAQLNGAIPLYASNTTHVLFVLGASATFTNYVATSGSSPGSWSTNDVITISGRYQAA